MPPIALDPIAIRVARRHIARLCSGPAELELAARRVAIEYQRRQHGLERVDDDEEAVEAVDHEVEDAGQYR